MGAVRVPSPSLLPSTATPVVLSIGPPPRPPAIHWLSAPALHGRLGKAHIDLLACGLAAFAPRLVVGLEKLYGIDIRASTDDTGNDVNGADHTPRLMRHPCNMCTRCCR